MLRSLLIVCALTTLLFDRASAQGQATWPPLSQLSPSLYLERPATPLNTPLLASEPSDTAIRQIRPTHWKEGGLVGALLLGGFGVWFGYEICKNSDDTTRGCTGAVLGGGLGGGVIGFLIGALIGGQFPKDQKSAPAEST